MRRSIVMSVVLGLAAMGCKKGDDKPKDPVAGTPAGSATDPAKDPAKDPAPTTGDPLADVGVEPGGIEHDKDDGAAAVLTAVEGTVEVRRVGETDFAAGKADLELYEGDVVRTGETSTATIALADESVIEVAEVSTVGIATRDGSADPASAAAVLSGLARFTVTARAPGEGAFRVYTPGGVVLTRGTTYGVGVAASGEARVGVEDGTVDVIGIAAMDADPIVVEGGNAVILAPSGTVAAPTAWPEDDWGTWRDDVDAKLEAEAAIDTHGQAMAELNTELSAGYTDLDTTADSVATFEAAAATSADADDTAAYEASLPDGAATIDASFSVAGRLELLTWAYASHAALATDIYVRHPQVETRWQVIAPRVDAAILWPKRYEVVRVGYLQPLRVQYYVHHPRGRVHADLVGVSVPAFYARIDPPMIEPARVRGRIKTRVWIAPVMAYRPSTRAVWIASPEVGWRLRVKNVRPAKMRGKAVWYVRPPQLRSKIVFAPVKGKYVAKIKIKPAQPRAALRAKWKKPVGVRVKVAAPDLRAAATARAKVKLDGGRVVVKVRQPGAGVVVKGGGNVVVKTPGTDVVVKGKGGAGAGGGGKVKIGAGAGGGGGGKAKIDAGAKVKIKAPDVKVKVKAPDVKVKVKGKGKIKIGG
jgi:hypothetical protein